MQTIHLKPRTELAIFQLTQRRLGDRANEILLDRALLTNLLRQVLPSYQVHSSANPRLLLFTVQCHQIVGILQIEQGELRTQFQWLATEILLWQEQAEIGVIDAIALLLLLNIKSPIILDS